MTRRLRWRALHNSTFQLGDQNGPVFKCISDPSLTWNDQNESSGTNVNNTSLVYRMQYKNESAIFLWRY